MGKEKSNNIGNKIVKAIIIIVVLLDVAIFSIFSGIIGIFTEFAEKFSNDITHIGAWETIKRDIFGMAGSAQEGFATFKITDDNIAEFKDLLESNGIDTENSGFTEILVRKMFIANIVSTSLDKTIVIVPIKEEDIVNHIKGKDPTRYGSYNSLSQCLVSWSSGDIKNSDDIWPVKRLHYTLYYDSKVFYYFKDTSKYFDDNYNGWYLAAMGATTFTPQGSGTGLNAYSDSEWEVLINSDLDKEENREKLRTGYKLVSADVIQLATLSYDEFDYNYSIQYGNNEGQINSYQAKDSEKKVRYHVQTQDVSLSRDIDTTTYAIPIELMIDFLDVTGSGEFLETFIDFALEKIDVKVDGYITKNVSYEYKKSEYNIPQEELILEVYDMMNAEMDIDTPNFYAYKDIIYNRKYEGNPINRLTDVEDYDQINAEGAAKLDDYFKLAYDPAIGFSRSHEFKVKETQTIKTTSEEWNLSPKEVNSWYGTTTYTNPTLKHEYIIGLNNTNDEEEFNKYGTEDAEFTEAGMVEGINSEYEIETKYVPNMYDNMLTLTEKNDSSKHLVDGNHNNDMFDNRLEIEKISGSRWYDISGRIVWALGEIAKIDEGEKNASLGAGAGSDYIYTKYKKTDYKEYNVVTKIDSEVLDKSNVTVNVGGSEAEVNARLYEFLELLKNETGTIPDFIGSSGGFKKDGIVVKYGDIYKGHIPAGDLLLDNAAEKLFELLKSSDNTQGLVMVFMYLAQLYKDGVDYGVTASDLTSAFALNSITGIYGNSPQEKIWFALKAIGCTDEAAAGALGNIEHESGFKSNNLQNSYNTAFGMSDEQYTAAVDNGTYTNFIHDSGGYGLAQWTDSERKGLLYSYLKDNKNVSISDEDCQIQFLVTEISGSGDAQGLAKHQWSAANYNQWKNSTSIEEATRIFCTKFERAGTPALASRTNAANKYYKEFHGKTAPVAGNFNGDLVSIAEQCHEYLRINNYYYSSPANKNAGHYVYDQSSTGSSVPKPAQGEGTWVDCSSYVSWVLYEYGYKKEFGGWQHVASTFINNKSRYERDFGWVYKSPSQAQAGDIIVRSDHIEIYAGNGRYLNCGTTEAIRRPLTDGKWGTNYLNNFTYAITVTPPPASQNQ